MKRDTKSIGHEIIHQILISEICFDICKEIPIIPGRGSDFLPFYYNLIYTKGIIILHGLLLSNSPNELSLKNFLKQYAIDFPGIDILDFEKEITLISEEFRIVLPISLRNKVCAHIDQDFKHTDFTCAYIIPDSVDKYLEIVKKLKNIFFEFFGHAKNDYPFHSILEQSKIIIDIIKK